VREHFFNTPAAEWSPTVRRRHLATEPRRPRPAQGLRRLPGAVNTRASRP
jgi:hypothetical protein